MARKTPQQRRIEALLKKHGQLIQTAFMGAVHKGANAIDLSEVERLLRLGDLEGAIRLVTIPDGLLYPISRAIAETIAEGGLAVAKDLPKGLSGVFGFNGAHPRAVALAERQSARLLTNLNDELKDSARKVITNGLDTNRSLNSVARDLVGRKVGRTRKGGIIGLTGTQTDRMINMRSMLSDPSRISDYFKDAAMTKPRYSEANRRFDGLVRRAIKDGKALSATDVDKIAEAYRSKASDNRAKVIARNEAFTAQAAGRDEGYQQLLDSGKVKSVTKKWQHGFSNDPREDHQRLDGKVLNFDEPFIMGDGTSMRFPHDPAGGAKHSIYCRCTCVYRVNLPRD